MKENKCFEIKAQKVGCKSFIGRSFSIYAKDGVTTDFSNRYFGWGHLPGVERVNIDGLDVKMAITKIVNALQESGCYSRVAVKECGKRLYVYDWHMDTEHAEVQKMGYAEYKRKRSELKAQIKALEAQIKELENEWYNGL
jgi:hypothetical protein